MANNTVHSPIPRVAAVHDISGFGRSSLCNVLPILATMGVQACPIPTAVLSTHSGGFDGYTFHDLTETIPGCIRHWQQLGLGFDAIYSGFLGSPRQVELVMELIRTFRTPDTLVLVDPVLGDGGGLYSSISPDMVQEMRRLVGMADVIVPNTTEAALLLGEQPGAVPEDIATLKQWLQRLSDLGPGTVLITSAPEPHRPHLLGVAAYERDRQAFWRILTPRLDGNYPGTGDIFASVLVGGLLHRDSLTAAADRAVQFIAQCIKVTGGYGLPRRDGVLLELELPLLRETLKLGECEPF